MTHQADIQITRGDLDRLLCHLTSLLCGPKSATRKSPYQHVVIVIQNEEAEEDLGQRASFAATH